MTIVIDASVTIGWLLGETERAESCIRQAQIEGALVPSIWPYEVANAISVAARRARIQEADRPKLLGLAFELDLDIEETRLSAVTEADDFSRKYGLTAYDAAYLALAQRWQATLATLDADLRTAAKKEKVALLPA